MVVCSICMSQLPSVDELGSHLLFYHQCCKNSSFLCYYCKRSFKFLIKFKHHLEFKHANAEHDLNNVNNVNNVDIPEQVDIIVVGNVEHENLAEENIAPDGLQSSLENFINTLYSNVQSYVAQLYSIPSVCRKLVDEIITATCELLAGPLTLLKDNVFKFMSSFDNLPANYADEGHKIESMFEAVSNPFQAMKTESQRLSALSEAGFFYQT